MSKTIISFLLLIYSLQSTIAQQYAFHKITTDDGLPSSECYQLLQDSKGYIWVSTNAGVGKYNGRTFKTFSTENGLPTNIVFKTFEDEQGRLFFITGNAKLGYIKNDSVYQLPIGDTLSKKLSNGKFFIYYMGNYDQEHFLISTQQGFFTLDKKTLRKLTLLTAPEGVTFWIKVFHGKTLGSYCPTINLPKSNGTIAFNLCSENNNKRTILQVNVDIDGAGPSIFKTCYLRDGRILAGFSTKILIISNDGTFQTLKLPSPLTSINQDKNGGVWISMLNNGLFYYPPEKSIRNERTPFIDLNGQPQHLFMGESPTDVLMDNEGGIWVSTLYNGIYFCPNLGIYNYSNIPELSNKLYSLDYIAPNILTNGMNNKIVVFKNKNEYKITSLPESEKVLGAHSYFKQGSKIYAAGYTTSYILDTNLHFSKPLLDSDKNNMFIYRFAETTEKKIIGVRASEIVYLNNDRIIHSTILPYRGRDIEADDHGNIYVATNQGLFLLKGAQFSPVPLVSGRINKLKKDPEGNMWVCSDGNGIFETDRFKVKRQFSKLNGLPSDICYDIAFDQDKNIWVATNKGLCFIDHLHSTKIFTLKKQNGLLSNEIFKIEVRQNELYICTQKGLCAAEIRDLHPNLVSPKVYIALIKNNKTSIPPNNIFNYDQNSFDFSVEGISFQNPTDITYEYRLKGYDSSWNVNTTGQITFNNLTDGFYTFEVNAINSDGIKSLKPANYSFLISKPFWKQLWFILFLLITTIGCIYLIIIWRIQLIKRKEYNRTNTNRIMAEYHMSALRSQMNPHFIFNAINSIQHYILNNEKQKAYDYLTKFSKLIRRVLSDSKKNTSTLKKEIELLELYISLEQLRFKDRFEYLISYEDTLSIDEIEIPIMLLQPYVENAIWHGIMNLHNERKGVLKISFEYKNEILKIAVEDNGVGRVKAGELKSNNMHESIGMRLSLERIEALKVISHKDAKIIITDLQNESGPCGTRVELYITIIL